MIVWWGTSVRRHPHGHIAEYCRLCHRVRKFKVFEIRRTDHLYSISLGPGQTAGHVAECPECGLGVAADPVHYRSLRGPAGRGLADLAKLTNPDLLPRLDGLEALDAQVRAGKAPADAKERLVRDAVAAAGQLVPQVVARRSESFGGIEVDAVTILAGIVSMIVPFAFILVNEFYLARPELKMAGPIVFGLMPLGVIALLVTLRLRVARRFVVPVLARALVDLDPSVEQLEEEWSLARGQRNPIVRYISPQSLRRRIEVLAATRPPPGS